MYNGFGIGGREQSNARDEATHLAHQGGKQTPSGDCQNAPIRPSGEKPTPWGGCPRTAPFIRLRALKGTWGKVITQYTQIAGKTLRH